MRNLIEKYQPKPIGEKRRYAVFIPLIWENNDWHLLYEIRSQQISQPGEVSFPGGRVEVGETYQEAAVRETMEELAISSDAIDLWGEIDYSVQSQRTIHCFVGQLMIDDWRLLKSNDEVECFFTVPLSQLRKQKPVYYDLHSQPIKTPSFPFDRIRNGIKYPFKNQQYAIPFYEQFDHLIWGMTAQFTKCLTDILNDESIAKKNPLDIEKSKGR
ncbi:NUDIX hydrolase [Streptococcus ictaluri]|uniref:Hydrolase, NUDIX family n=1 Tax=Streptococcus ictaluri 707-05 TaxID=764299 RepID=G5K0Q1_9STRE|nr:CoA pyrophosphatase [Streptococcus ictaluri]EHI70537.1 hydrolase, NUDIX family [Streptococcus ictaluri 707-05]